MEVAEAPLSSALLQLVRAHASLATRRLQELGLVPPQEVVLLYLDDHGPSAQRDLVGYLGRDRSTVTATIQAMERADLVFRHPAANSRRALVVAPTSRGARLCPAVRAVWRELEEATFGGLHDGRRAELAEILRSTRDRVTAHLEEAVVAVSPQGTQP